MKSSLVTLALAIASTKAQELVGGDCASLPPAYQAECYASRASTTAPIPIPTLIGGCAGVAPEYKAECERNNHPLIGGCAGVAPEYKAECERNNHPLIGGCAGVAPEYRAECERRASATSTPTLIGGCAGVAPEYKAECERRASATATPSLIGGCAGVAPEYREECERRASATATPTLIGGDCASLPPQYQAACYASRSSITASPTPTGSNATLSTAVVPSTTGTASPTEFTGGAGGNVVRVWSLLVGLVVVAIL
ncbi:hypothetical protein HYFRA_00002962 [Hymenoscyphus fraxineus]|uniref:Uncharacterized protein n=1 Tax=Hymenoscyphus fraxineus TaxID=746836 RepID=A0A9N9PP75_9HELO|nr:hypothetical protein HYFRA_00002962 [Hymenoscyphus fraxineus]